MVTAAFLKIIFYLWTGLVLYVSTDIKTRTKGFTNGFLLIKRIIQAIQFK